ncbi:MAG: BamA/TamA family outer membrane protein [Gemmatimonadaceae bacterium]
MIAFVAAALAFQTSVSIGVGKKPKADSTKRDSAQVARDSARAARRDSIRDHWDSVRAARANRPPRRDSVTPALLASAFRSAAAGSLLGRARMARLEQDSTLTSYDATSYTRISAGLGFKKLARDRLIFRHENVARVRWQRGKGAWIDVKGSRSIVPGVPSANAQVDGAYAIPYYPGNDAIWVGAGIVKREVDDREIVHPLAEGAEAYYQYTVGDSITFHLPDGKEIRLVELEVTARRPRWNLIVGSFWFDAASAQLVRAAYRLSTPMDIVQVAKEAQKDDPDGDDDDIPRWLRPMQANIKGMTVEYGLHQGRWWLPRVQRAQGEVQVSFMRSPVTLENSFKYASVNGIDTLPTFPRAERDSLAPGDSAARDSTRRRRRSNTIDDGDAHINVGSQNEGTLRVVTRTPKDSAKLANAPELPASIYDAGDDLFGKAEAERLMKELDFGLQANWAPQPPTLHYGLGEGLLRYNRVEGLSAGASVEQEFGRGYAGRALLRLGTADLRPNGEIGITRGNGRRTLGLIAFRRLGVANDWGDPLAFGPSLSAFLFARDEGVYYRTWGAEATGTFDLGSTLTMRLFAERQGDARVETQFSLAKVINDVRFLPNIDATGGDVAGAALRLQSSRGLDPHGFRLLSDLRAEGGVGELQYARGAFDATLSHGLGRRLDGALTLSAGTSAGTVPTQRLWYLGGSQTIRGQTIGAAAGDAFWMARAELGTSMVALRPVVFYDVGWAGSRSLWSHPGRPISGAGVGLSIMDGLLRFDLAKGIRPDKGVRADFYLEARF